MVVSCGRGQGGDTASDAGLDSRIRGILALTAMQVDRGVSRFGDGSAGLHEAVQDHGKVLFGLTTMREK
jgi:hypothetical protein